MEILKEKLLQETYEKLIDVGVFGNHSLDIMDEIVARDIMGFGTTADEKILSSSELRALFTRQREQSKDIEIRWNVQEFNHRISADENSAVFADDITFMVIVDKETIPMKMRFSIVFEFVKDRWLAVHFHGSKPEHVISETDTFGIEEWKQKNIELEKIIEERTQQLTIQKEELEKALHDLRSTQSQLIQSEKMASLGELTAGIAHEIQNPLNFVNNFSEVNQELLAEMNLEIEKGNYSEVKEIAKDVSENEQKINHHGKRADAIVKGMLQHSQSSSGVKEPTDINKLADEYLRLAYHGLRAKDKSFNAIMKTDFDESLSANEAGIGSINIIPQDIGRVILNLITNAFYAVGEKKKQIPNGYEPTVSINTKKINGKVEIKVTDNGNGIPQKVLDKIFQPFFTTKPTGQGTGLGLSLAYDIVKAHGGELKVETMQGEGQPAGQAGSTFIIQLPTN